MADNEELKVASEKSFRQEMTELDGIVSKLEGNSLELEESLTCYEQGVKLLGDLRSRLDKAQQKVDTLMGELEKNDTDEEVDTTLHKA
ncbi:MAG: exodeoxyribonuclease VII small subunit [Eggerthellaceae bacterium]|jgi:exodeoxyribonuclease VII small subunit|nr:exodeoxyribonuclease VII small subunit [Eggerthellaceae bacterium]MCH4220572.1 exodeoxyribonuclease VII small subunit [Eggerthellaceae bacterium]